MNDELIDCLPAQIRAARESGLSVDEIIEVLVRPVLEGIPPKASEWVLLDKCEIETLCDNDHRWIRFDGDLKDPDELLMFISELINGPETVRLRRKGEL